MTTRTVHCLFVLAAGVGLLAGCGQADPGAAERDAQLERLTASVDELTRANRDLAEAVRRQNRHIAMLGRGLSMPEDDAAAEDDAGAPGDPEAAAGAVPAAAGTAAGADAAVAGAVQEILATEAGQKAIQQAAAAEVAKREAQERRTFVSFTIGRFATEAGLDAHQTDELQRIWKESLDSGAELRKRFTALRELPEADRPAAQEKAMAFMREIGRDRNERVAALLTQTQLEAYQPVEEEIVSSLHGAPRGGARRGATERRE